MQLLIFSLIVLSEENEIIIRLLVLFDVFDVLTVDFAVLKDFVSVVDGFDFFVHVFSPRSEFLFGMSLSHSLYTE